MNPFLRLIPAIALACFALPGHALYKVVGPDGSVTYTDRPPPAAVGRPAPTAGGRDTGTSEAANALANLPLELRQVTARYPVTLYSSTDCAPCDSARRLLASRGIPYVERRVVNDDDGEALNRLTGGRSVPTLTIGTQALRGFAEGDWQSYLDAAGYPRESRLPRSYQQPAATPLVERQAEAAPQQRPAAPPPAEPAPPPPAPPAPAGIRF